MIRFLTWPLRAVCWAVMVPAVIGLVVSAALGKIALEAERWLSAFEFKGDYNRFVKRNASRAIIENGFPKP